MTHTAARHAVQLLQHYFVKRSFSAHASFKQTTLDSFFYSFDYNQLMFVTAYQKFAYLGQLLKSPGTKEQNLLYSLWV